MMRIVLMTLMWCAAALCGCTTTVRSSMTEVRGRVWSEPVTITVPNADTVGLYDLSIALRHDAEAAGTSVAVSVRTESPDSLWTEESLTVTLYDDGRSRPTHHETSRLYRCGVRLAHEGDYRITITPAQPVRGVSAVGIDMTPRAAD